MATDEEAIKAYRAALQTALEGPSAAHPTEGFGDDNLSLSQARHGPVRWGFVAGKASCHSSCAAHCGQHAVQPEPSHGSCTYSNAHGAVTAPSSGALLSAGDQAQGADCGDCCGIHNVRHSPASREGLQARRALSKQLREGREKVERRDSAGALQLFRQVCSCFAALLGVQCPQSGWQPALFCELLSTMEISHVQRCCVCPLLEGT